MTMRVTVMPAVGNETLVHVSSSEVVSWEDVEAALSAEDRASLIGLHRTYLPALRPTDSELAEGHWLCDEWTFDTADDAALLRA